jgi:predicted lysophospholipase L1 biosynthesis ABC-type transport system permease subunit
VPVIITSTIGLQRAPQRRLVVGEELRLGALGAIIGVAGEASVLVAASPLASYVPTRRATHVDSGLLVRSE